MLRFNLHTAETAPPGSQDLLRRVATGFGFLPTLFAKLAEFTREVVRQRGQVNDGDLNVFLAAGYTMEQMLDVVMGVALKTFTNYASHIVRPSLNSEFAGDYWTAPANEPLPLDEQVPKEDEHDVTARGRARH